MSDRQGESRRGRQGSSRYQDAIAREVERGDQESDEEEPEKPVKRYQNKKPSPPPAESSAEASEEDPWAKHLEAYHQRKAGERKNGGGKKKKEPKGQKPRILHCGPKGEVVPHLSDSDSDSD